MGLSDIRLDPASGSPGLEFLWLSRLRTRLVSTRMWVRSLALLSGLRIQCCHELWWRLQMWLRSRVTVAVMQAGSYKSDLTPSLGTSICCGCGPKKLRKKKKRSPGLVVGSSRAASTVVEWRSHRRLLPWALSPTSASPSEVLHQPHVQSPQQSSRNKEAPAARPPRPRHLH